jgi:hypothetical protein
LSFNAFMTNLPERIVLISRWDLGCPPERVAALLAAINLWPSWWKYIKEVDVMHRVAAGKAGTRAKVTLKLQFGGQRVLQVLVARIDATPEGRREIEIEAEGADQNRRGLWILEPLEGGTTGLTYRWEAELVPPRFAALRPIIRAIITREHVVAMKKAAAGMVAHFQCTISAQSHWSGGSA